MAVSEKKKISNDKVDEAFAQFVHGFGYFQAFYRAITIAKTLPKPQKDLVSLVSFHCF